MAWPKAKYTKFWKGCAQVKILIWERTFSASPCLGILDSVSSTSDEIIKMSSHVAAKAPKRPPLFCQKCRLYLKTHKPMTQRSQSRLTLLLSRHSVGIYPETSSHPTYHGTFSHNRCSSLSHCGLSVA